MKMQWLWNVLAIAALALGLGIWIALPWFLVLALVAVLAVLLLVTRSGRLSLAAARIGIASLPQRWGASSVIVVGIAGVVGVLVAMLAMGQGFQATLDSTGDDTTAIVLRGGSQAETNSVITRDQVPLIASLAGVARGADNRPLVSPELSQVVNLQSKSDGTDVNAQFRGVGEQGWAVHDKVKLLQGRRFQPGLREIVVGKGAQSQFRGLQLGQTLTLGNQAWTVVGVFASGDAHDSELWTDTQTLATTYNRSAYQSISVRTQGQDGFRQFKAAMDADPRLKLDVFTTREYYRKQGGNLSKVLEVLGTFIGTIMAIGAVFGALNTMYAAVATRAREIATMRALGFRGLPVVVAVMLETMLLALLGGVLGGLIAWAIFNGYSVSTLGSNFSQVVFQFKVSPPLLWTGLKWALGIGLVGGLFPALRAARLPITTALRAL
ncbi:MULTISPECIES: ABC transporter permease [Xanthomonas]|uniref:Macrolide export ATP-binding/permease protein MacB n=1 Tax=Xanthomonas sacchari TaxID=56458 RepID=A0ABT3DTI8_9XANT|nr:MULTISPECIES: ABC transporter permease [Xanthomonas]MCW0398810.1 Macrolide export ATP-binding/permease protein MacB [Xanthomonas sacchari]MCW0418458.1 Macrolide export ATP-binding/permease protein MacB [Xanthomonas sacchari]MCW0448460.1 Macrolide export ATP-binding/permease protein MacB [Xanthomonas sacchari]MDY4341880.1 ABC transporter permease [Xanthomonas sp. LF07-6]UYK72483.1 ABC transporter permease [Xanthomonas sacchari]